MKPRYRYGILDDFDEVIRWVPHKPTGYRYIRQRLASSYEVSRDLGDATW